ncbi:MAG: hypothetical protein KF883_15010 [Thermomicrobiales bacterium]|nr:hypothetical protein [Thermomicrobiales bacterium]
MLEGKIFLRRSDNSLVALSEQPYEAEELLQHLLAEHPDLLAGDQIDAEAPRKWLFVGREIGIPGQSEGGDWWSLDHLFLDQDVIPTFVEVKRSADTRSRREVVTQMLDYAANATEYWPVSRMREDHAKLCEAAGVDPEDHFAQVFGPGIENGTEEYWRQAERNLREGRIRLLFVADRIPVSLRRIIEFLNHQMDPAEVLALEVRQFVGAAGGEGLQTLVPRVIGQSESLRKSSAGVALRRKRLPEISAEEIVSRFPEAARDVIVSLLRKSRDLGWSVRTKAHTSTQNVELGVTQETTAFAAGSDGYFWSYLKDPMTVGRLSVEERAAYYSLIREIDPTRSPESKGSVGVRVQNLTSPESHQRLLALFEMAVGASERMSSGDQREAVRRSTE